MSEPASPPPLGPTSRSASDEAFHRSGAVARMLRMPVATLRVWERRYAVARPAVSPSGQRLYSAADVRRLALLRQLTELGHAIGSLAALDMPQLQAVAATHAGAIAGAHSASRAPAPSAPAGRAWRVAVVGSALAARLRHPALTSRLARPTEWVGAFDDVAQACAGLAQGPAVDALVIHEPRLHDEWLASIDAAAPALAAVPKAVLYRFAPDRLCERLASAGVALLREPQADAAIGQWLRGLCLWTLAAPAKSAPSLRPSDPAPPRRWDDATLADFAGLSSTVACECPRHVAELLMQLSHFEAYSAECEDRSAADAALHAYLNRVAAQSRALFEAALEHVVLHEGLILPSQAPRGD